MLGLGGGRVRSHGVVLGRSRGSRRRGGGRSVRGLLPLKPEEARKGSDKVGTTTRSRQEALQVLSLLVTRIGSRCASIRGGSSGSATVGWRIPVYRRGCSHCSRRRITVSGCRCWTLTKARR